MRANSKLPDDAFLLREYHAGATQEQLATKYGVMAHTIARHLQAATEANHALSSLQGAPAWHQAAACADPQTEPEVFFPDAAHPARLAKSICRSCLVRQACLQWALDNYETHGVWGGYTPQERRNLLKTRRAS